jgi:hypothetical protein
MKKAIFTILSCFSFVIAADIDPIFTPQRVFYSAVQKSLGDAGIALPTDLSSAILNPAASYSYRRAIPKNRGSVLAGYARDSIYDRNILPFAVSYAAGNQGTVALFYRYLDSYSGLKDNEVTLNFSGQMAPQCDNQGPVDFGINIRFESNKMSYINSFPTYTTIKDSSGKWINDKVSGDNDILTKQNETEKRFAIDIGFFQSNITPGLDFGLTMKNLTGYRWIENSPYNTFKDSGFVRVNPDSTTDSVVLHWVETGSGVKKSRCWTQGGYRTISAGLNYRFTFANGKIEISLPADLEMLGLFDKKIKNKFVFHGGVQGKLSNNFYVRLGYSRAPISILTDLNQIKNVNVFTGGAGIAIAPVNMNFYISNNSLGLTSSFDF